MSDLFPFGVGNVAMFIAHTSEAFSKYIEHQVTTNGMTYMEAIIDFCEKRKLDVETVVPLLGDKLKTKLAEEGQALHLLAKRSGLPIE